MKWVITKIKLLLFVKSFRRNSTFAYNNLSSQSIVDNNKNDYLDFLSINGFSSFINVFTRLPKGQQHSCLYHV